jgi:hypothetical protein
MGSFNYFKINLLAFVLGCVSNSAALADETTRNKYVFSSEPNGLGLADHYGKLSGWCNVGKLELSQGVNLPLKFNFHSSQDKVGSSILGWNWWFPAVESSVVKKSEDHIVAHMIGGSRLHLYKTAADTNVFRSSNHAWIGRDDGSGGFKIVNAKEGWKLDFSKGKLQGMKLPNGEELQWKYGVSGKPEAIIGNDGREILEVQYDLEGKPSEIIFQGVNEQKKVELHVGSPSEVGLPLPVMALKRFNSPCEKVAEFTYQINGDKDYLMKAKHLSGSSSSVKNRAFKWGSEDAIIKSAMGDTYTITPKGKRPLLSKEGKDNKKSSYHYNTKTGVSEFITDGRTIIRQYILSAGVNKDKFRAVILKDKLGKVIDHSKLYYNKNGNLIRTVSSVGESFPMKINPEKFQVSKKGGRITIKINDAGVDETRVYSLNGDLLEVRK